MISSTTLSFSQDYKKNVFELYIDMGFSNDFGKQRLYQTLSFMEEVFVENKRFISARNFGISYSRYLNDQNGIKFQFGKAKYGFDFEGITGINKRPVIGFQHITHLEFGLSYIRRIPLGTSSVLLIEPGFRYHYDASPQSDNIFVRVIDSFSFSSYTGMEFPMMGDRFFANLGLQIKLPILRYNRDIGEPAYYPYFIGLRVGVNYQF